MYIPHELVKKLGRDEKINFLDTHGLGSFNRLLCGKTASKRSALS